MERILYSCFGTTDPVRGMKDGGMLHILRFYRPTTVYLFLSAEIVRRDREDDRINKTFAFCRENWDGYAPKVVRFNTDIQDPSDMDALLEPMHCLLQQAAAECPGSEILLNLSSGTPQMQIILSQMALDARYRCLGIQVKNPEGQSGTTERTNSKRYPVDEALGLNEDEEQGAENRCSVPKMIAVRREATRNRLYGLLARRNYAAIGQMGSDLPGHIVKLARHLDYRSRFLLEEAEQEAQGLSGMGLQVGRGVYPYNVYRLIEYFAMLKHLVHSKRYTDFLLRLNPFLVQFQLLLLGGQLKPLGFEERDLFTVVGGRKKFSPWKMQQKLPELLAFMEQAMNGVLEERDVSIWGMNVMLGFFSIDESLKQLLEACETANSALRNSAAHDLFTITNEDIARVCGSDAETLLRGLESHLIAALASYNDRNLRKRINIYDHGDRIIRECL